MADVLFRATDDGYLATYIAHELEFAIERLHWKGDELHAQLSVSCSLPGAKTVNGTHSISAATFNVSSTRARRDRAKELAERIRAKGQIDLIGIVEEVSQLTLTAERQGQPAVMLRNVPRPDPDDEWDVDGFRFSKRHPTIVFGDGGTAKSLHALYTAGVLAQRGLRVALCDWELDAAAHRLRLERLFGRDMPDVRYVFLDRPLVYAVDRLKRIVRDERLDFGFFDSVGFACSGPPEAADSATDYFRAVRRIGIGSLHIAHVRQGDDNDRRPFGSAFWHNSARSTWFAKLGDTSPAGAGRQRIEIGLYNRKNNLNALHPAVGFRIWFEKDQTQFDPINVTEVQELAESLPLWQRMRQTVARGPMTLASLAEELGAKVDTLDREVRRRSGLFTRVSSQDGIRRIALVARDA